VRLDLPDIQKYLKNKNNFIIFKGRKDKGKHIRGTDCFPFKFIIKIDQKRDKK